MNLTELNQLNPYLDGLLADGLVPALSICVVRHDDTWIYHGGVKDLDTQEPNRRDTLFDLASLTKVMATTSSILQLRDEGYLRLQDPLSRYLPGCTVDATMEQCLLHATGCQAGKIDYRYMDGRQLREAVLHHPQVAELIGQPVYSDVNFILLGWVVEQASPYHSLRRHVEERILKPLHLQDTGFCPTDKERCCAYEKTADDGTVRGRVHDGKAFRLGGVCGHAGLFSAVDDIALFLHAFLREDPALLRPETFRELYVPHISTPQRVRTYGWILRDVDRPVPKRASGRTLFHTGFTGNYLYIDKERDTGIGVLSNRIHPDRRNRRIIEQLQDIYDHIDACLE